MRYVHVFNRFVSGKRSFEYFAGLVFVVFVAAVVREIALAAGFVVYVASGPVKLLVEEIRRRRLPLEVAEVETSGPPAERS
jgi:hypothetical protein